MSYDGSWAFDTSSGLSSAVGYFLPTTALADATVANVGMTSGWTPTIRWDASGAPIGLKVRASSSTSNYHHEAASQPTSIGECYGCACWDRSSDLQGTAGIHFHYNGWSATPASLTSDDTITTNTLLFGNRAFSDNELDGVAVYFGIWNRSFYSIQDMANYSSSPNKVLEMLKRVPVRSYVLPGKLLHQRQSKEISAMLGSTRTASQEPDGFEANKNKLSWSVSEDGKTLTANLDALNG